jgi:hypothetical protein
LADDGGAKEGTGQNVRQLKEEQLHIAYVEDELHRQKHWMEGVGSSEEDMHLLSFPGPRFSYVKLATAVYIHHV